MMTDMSSVARGELASGEAGTRLDAVASITRESIVANYTDLTDFDLEYATEDIGNVDCESGFGDLENLIPVSQRVTAPLLLWSSDEMIDEDLGLGNHNVVTQHWNRLIQREFVATIVLFGRFR